MKAQQNSARYKNKLTETYSRVLLNAIREKIHAKFSFLVMHRQHLQEGLYYLTLGHATPITDFWKKNLFLVSVICPKILSDQS